MVGGQRKSSSTKNIDLHNSSRCAVLWRADSSNNPRIVPNSWGKKHWPGTKDMAVAIGCCDPLFVNFLEGCLRWDKNQRMTPEELMQHPWMVGVCELFFHLSDLLSGD